MNSLFLILIEKGGEDFFRTYFSKNPVQVSKI